MRVLNIHQRSIPRPAAEVGRLLDTLASDHDQIWPRALWPAMRFDRPLGVAADGGHGPVRYAVIDYETGRRVRFIFKAPRGFNGWHELEVLPEGDGTLLRHTIEMNATGPALLTWPLAIRWLHDACLEDAFATAEASLGLVPTIVPWSPWVKFLRRAMSGGKAGPQTIDSFPADMITPIPAPPAARISSEIPGSHFHDCYLMPWAHGGRSALDIYLKTVARSPRWVEVLMAVRNRVVGLFGLKNLGHLGSLPPLKEASAYKVGDRVGIFTLLSASDDEVILGDSDKHLNVKVSLCKVMRDGREAVAMTTVVHIHNRLGRIYMLFVAPMHRIIAPAVMARSTEAYPMRGIPYRRG